MLFRRFFH